VPGYGSVYTRSRVQRRAVLRQADVVLDLLRLQLRLSCELHLLSTGQCAHVSRLVTEVGKLLGTWRKAVEK